MFWLASTLHKIPAILMIKLFSLTLNTNLLWLSILSTVFLSGVIMLSTVDLRMLLVLSSVGNNSWFILSQMANMYIFLFFIFTYSLSLFFLLNSFLGLSKPTSSLSYTTNPYGLSIWVLSLSGIPPFPLFYGNILVILSFLYNFEFNYFFVMFLLFNSLMIIGYIQSLMKYFIYVYSSNTHYLLNY